MYDVEILDVAALFRKILPIASKYLLRSLFRYIQHTPLKLMQDNTRSISTRMEAIAWACKKRVKLKEVHFCYFPSDLDLGSSLDLRIYEHLFRSCDITQLERLEIFHYDTSGYSYHCSQSPNMLLIAMKQGFPFEVVYETADEPESSAKFERFVAEYIPRHAKSVRKMNITIGDIKDGNQRLSVLTSFLHSLEEVTLNVNAHYAYVAGIDRPIESRTADQVILQQGYKRDLETISNSIGRMTNLKS